MPKRQISGLDIAGDSLSDRRAFADRQIGPVSGAFAAGISKTSPRGRFTNGFTWSDYVAESIAGRIPLMEAHLNELAHPHNLNDADLADRIISDKSPKAKDPQQLGARNADLADDLMLGRAGTDKFNLDDNTAVRVHDKPVVRTYAEGGLTAANWKAIDFDIHKEAQRFILSTLEQKDDLQFANDRALDISDEEKAARLQIIWAGANDLITVNDKPSPAIAKIAIDAIKQSIIRRYEHGYREFRLLNLPDLSKTPRYNVGGSKADEGQIARESIEAYNQYMAEAVAELADTYPEMNIGILDVAQKYKDIESHPENYGIDPNDVTQPFVESADFNKTKLPDGESVSDSAGYSSWDDVHPTAKVHAFLGDWVLSQLNQEYNLGLPNQAETALDHINHRLSLDNQETFKSAVEVKHSKIYEHIKAIPGGSDGNAEAVETFSENMSQALAKAFKSKYEAQQTKEHHHDYFHGFFRRYKAPMNEDNIEAFIHHAKKRGKNSRSAKILLDMNILELKNGKLSENLEYHPSTFDQQHYLEGVITKFDDGFTQDQTGQIILDTFAKTLEQAADFKSQPAHRV